MHEHVAEHDRQLANMLRYGTVVAIQGDKAQVEVGDMTTDWLPWFTMGAGAMRSWSAPSVGTQVMIMSPSGDMAQGSILPAIYQDAYAAPTDDPNVIHFVMPDGTIMEYNSATSTLNTDLGGASIKATKTSIELKVGGCTVAITAAGLAITGGTLSQSGGSGAAATFGGDITSSGTVTGQTDVIGGGKSLKGHTNGGKPVD